MAQTSFTLSKKESGIQEKKILDAQYNNVKYRYAYIFNSERIGATLKLNIIRFLYYICIRIYL